MTGGRGRLAGLIRLHLAAGENRVTSISRSEGREHLGLENLFVNNLLDQTDTLLHLAWSTFPVSSERHVGHEWNEDIPLLWRLLNSIVASGRADRLHFVFFSSGGAVYGPALHDHASREEDSCAPIGWYGHAKLAAERIIEEFGRRHGLSYTILRVSNPYGFPGPSHKPQGIIPFLIKSALEQSPFNVWGDGSARKDFLHYSDFLTALDLVVQRRPQGTFNLSYGESHTISEVISLTEQATGQTIAKTFQPAYTWDVHDSLLDNRKLRGAIDWNPRVPLVEGLHKSASPLENPFTS